MAFSKARRLSDLVSSTGEISSFVDASITHADLHTNMDLTGKTVLVSTQTASDNDTSAASTAYVTTAISNLVDAAPGALNTLNELAAALGDDAAFSTTVTNSIATKLPLAGGTLTGALTGTSAAFNSGGTNIVATFTSTDGLGGIQLADDTGNVELVANGNNFEVRNAGGSATMVVENGGHVGIGTSPTHKLHVLSTDNKSFLLDRNTGNEPANLNEFSNFYSLSIKNRASGSYLNFGGNSAQTKIQATDGAGTAAAKHISLQPYGGNVGIGLVAANPATTLHVYHPSSHAEIRVATSGSSDSLVPALSINNTAVEWSIATKADNNLHFRENTDSYSTKMLIKDGNGFVGIGGGTANNPRYNLTVAGDNSTAIGIALDNASGSSTLDIAALGSGYGNHQAAAGEVWFYSPDNINIGGATGNTNDIKFIANNTVNMRIKGDGTGVDINQLAKVERNVNGSGTTSVEEILTVSRIGGASSNAQREAAISFFDSANSTYTAMITGVRTSPSGNYDGGLSIYTNSHSQNGNATSISEMVSGKAVHFGPTQSTEFFGDVYITNTNGKFQQNGVGRETKGGYVNGNATVSYTVTHTSASSMHIRCAMQHYGIMTSYGCARDAVCGNGTGGIYFVLDTSHTSATSGSWSINRVSSTEITITKNAGNYVGGGYYYIIVEGATL